VTRPGRRRRADSLYVEQAARLAAWLRDRREQAELSQEQLAARAQVAVATVRKIEKGIVIEPGYFTVLALMQALGAGREDTAVLGPVTRTTEFGPRSCGGRRRSTAGSWNGMRRNSSAISASAAIRRVVCAGQAMRARDRTSRNAPLAGFDW
jgi:transcriptional regulator with XRE-family HTH domain